MWPSIDQVRRIILQTEEFRDDARLDKLLKKTFESFSVLEVYEMNDRIFQICKKKVLEPGSILLRITS